MTSAERLIIEILAAVALIAGFAFYEQHKGATKCLAADSVAAVKQEAHNTVTAALDTQAINQQALDHAKAIAAAPDPSPALMCVRYITPRLVLQTTAPEPGSHEAPSLPAADSGGFDPSTALKVVGQTADAQVAELQSYVNDVCQRK